MQNIDLQRIKAAMTYPEYRQLVSTLHLKGMVTGPTQNFDLLNYSRLNERRMERLDKTFKLDATAAELLQTIQQPMIWISITESWCGDAAQIVPTIEHLSKLNPVVEHRLALRDENLDLIDAFLTNGGRSIPKIIFLDAANGTVLGHWGPRPKEVQAIMDKIKQQMDATNDPAIKNQLFEEAKTTIHTWYAHDKTISTQREFLQAVAEAATILVV